MGNDDSTARKFKIYLLSTFHIKDLESPKYFLEIEIDRFDRGICLNQQKFVLEIVSKAGLSRCKPTFIPIEQNAKLTMNEYGAGLSSSNEDPLLKDPSGYQQLIEKLIYLTRTRPYIYYAVQILNQFMHSPK